MKHYDKAARERLGMFITRARLAAGYGDTGKWADAIGRSTRVALGVERGESAGVNTYTAIENALGWLEGTCYRILGGMDLDEAIGTGSVGRDSEDDGYVAAPGERIEGGASDRAVLDAIEQMRQDVQAMEQRLSERLDRLEGSGS